MSYFIHGFKLVIAIKFILKKIEFESADIKANEKNAAK
tara:strand:- start:491 stop:604 length:114 start_codon:yes stop_codon:yes gene_type:complete